MPISTWNFYLQSLLRSNLAIYDQNSQIRPIRQIRHFAGTLLVNTFAQIQPRSQGVSSSRPRERETLGTRLARILAFGEISTNLLSSVN